MSPLWHEDIDNQRFIWLRLPGSRVSMLLAVTPVIVGGAA